MYTDIEIGNRIQEHRQSNGQKKLSPSRLKRAVEDKKRQLGIGVPKRDRNDPTGSEVAERERITKDVSPELASEWCASYPHGSLATLTARYSTERDQVVLQ